MKNLFEWIKKLHIRTHDIDLSYFKSREMRHYLRIITSNCTC